MFSHVIVGANDLEQSKKFYDAILGVLGHEPAPIIDDRCFYSTETGTFGISKPINGEPATHANGGTIGFPAASTEMIDAWHAAGVSNGGTSCEEPPGIREGGFGKLYLAYLRDPSGNKLCAVKFMS